jgi:chemotaxis protein CheC
MALMTTVPLDRDARLHVLHELLAAATHEASAAMCRWTEGQITLSLDEVR